MKIALLTSLAIFATLAKPSATAGEVSLELATFEGNLLGCTTVSKGVFKEPHARADAYSPVSFIAILSNGSDDNVDLYERWSSWGYFSIHFVVTFADGTTKPIQKKGRAWTKNYPAFFTLKSGQSHAIPVMFSDDDWTGLEALFEEDGATIFAVFHQEKKLEGRFREYDRYKDADIFHDQIQSRPVPVSEVLDPDSARRLQKRGEQGGGGQPATRPESK